MLGGLLALLSAAVFGFNNAATRRGVLLGSTLQGMAITVPMGTVLFLALCLATGSLGLVASFSLPALACFAMAGFAHFVFGRYCNYRAIGAIGTNLASPIQQWELLVTLTLAVIFLGEKLTPIALVAIGLLLAGPAIAARHEKPAKPASGGAKAVAEPAAAVVPVPQRKFEPRYAEGYFYAFLSIFGYGSSPIFVRAGLENASLGASFAAGLVSYIAATVIVAAWVIAGRQIGHVKAVEAEPRRWFVLAGFLVFTSQMLRYMALTMIPASIVAPIMRIQTLFRFYFSWLLTRDYEVFERNVILGTLISLAGALLIALPPETVTGWLPLPDWARAVLTWRWP